MNLHFHKSTADSNLFFLVTEENKVIGSIIGHCGGANYTARLLDPETLIVSDVAQVDRKLAEDPWNGDVAEQIFEEDLGVEVYDSVGTDDWDEEALVLAKDLLVKAAQEKYAEAVLV